MKALRLIVRLVLMAFLCLACLVEIRRMAIVSEMLRGHGGIQTQHQPLDVVVWAVLASVVIVGWAYGVIWCPWSR